MTAAEARDEIKVDTVKAMSNDEKQKKVISLGTEEEKKKVKAEDNEFLKLVIALPIVIGLKYLIFNVPWSSQEADVKPSVAKEEKILAKAPVPEPPTPLTEREILVNGYLEKVAEVWCRMPDADLENDIEKAAFQYIGTSEGAKWAYTNAEELESFLIETEESEMARLTWNVLMNECPAQLKTATRRRVRRLKETGK